MKNLNMLNAQELISVAQNKTSLTELERCLLKMLEIKADALDKAIEELEEVISRLENSDGR